ncbi:MAG: hypothetical protein WCI65_11190 [Synechococcaceae cyanobacterium ELA263]
MSFRPERLKTGNAVEQAAWSVEPKASGSGQSCFLFSQQRFDLSSECSNRRMEKEHCHVQFDPDGVLQTIDHIEAGE